MELSIFWAGIIESAIYSALGLVIALLAFFFMDLLTPGHLGKQLAKDQNMALAIVVASGVLGVSIIIAAAIHG